MEEEKGDFFKNPLWAPKKPNFGGNLPQNWSK